MATLVNGPQAAPLNASWFSAIGQLEILKKASCAMSHATFNMTRCTCPTVARRMPRDGLAGFTLIELTLVLAIAATLLAIAVPRYNQALMNYRADTAATQIVAAFERAHQEARTSSSPRTVRFSTDNHTCAVLIGSANDSDNLNSLNATHRVRLDQSPFYAQLAKVDFNGERFTTFNGYGKPTTGGHVVIKAGGLTRTITLDAQTGIASWE